MTVSGAVATARVTFATDRLDDVAAIAGAHDVTPDACSLPRPSNLRRELPRPNACCNAASQVQSGQTSRSHAYRSISARIQKLERVQLAPDVQVSCTTTLSSPTRRGARRVKIQRDSISLVGFSSPSISFR